MLSSVFTAAADVDGSNGHKKRRLQAAIDGCKHDGGFTYYNTTYNEDPRALPYNGIMFTIITKGQPIEIGTFELDLTGGTDAEDYEVSVYTYLGGYGLVQSDPSQWTKIVDKVIPTMVPIDETVSNAGLTALIPATEFSRVKILPSEVQSFYIDLNGPYLDNTASAMDKKGEEAYSNAHFSIQVGEGFAESHFPSMGSVQTTFPKFAGKIAYRIADESTCEKQIVSTSIKYKFVIDQGTASYQVMSAISSGIDNIIDQRLEGSTQTFNQWMIDYDLKKKTGARLAVMDVVEEENEVWGNACATKTEWGACTAVMGQVDFSYKIGLDPGKLLFELYTLTNDIEMKAAGYLENGNATQIEYVGHRAASGAYSTKITGVPTGESMNGIVQSYFAKRTRLYLQKYITYTGANVFDVTVEDQTPVSNRRRQLLRANGGIYGGSDGDSIGLQRSLQANDGEVVVTGHILGTQPARSDSDFFVQQLQDVLQKNKQQYLDFLRLGLIEPGEINVADEYQYFSNVEKLDSDIEAFASGSIQTESTDAPSTLPGAENGTIGSAGDTFIDEVKKVFTADNIKSVDTNIWIYVGAGAGGVLLILAAITIWCCCCKRKRNQRRRSHSKTEESGDIGKEQSPKKSTSKATSPASSVQSDRPPAVITTVSPVDLERTPPTRSSSFDNQSASHRPEPEIRGVGRSKSYETPRSARSAFDAQNSESQAELGTQGQKSRSNSFDNAENNAPYESRSMPPNNNGLKGSDLPLSPQGGVARSMSDDLRQTQAPNRQQQMSEPRAGAPQHSNGNQSQRPPPEGRSVGRSKSFDVDQYGRYPQPPSPQNRRPSHSRNCIGPEGMDTKPRAASFDNGKCNDLSFVNGPPLRSSGSNDQGGAPERGVTRSMSCEERGMRPPPQNGPSFRTGPPLVSSGNNNDQRGPPERGATRSMSCEERGMRPPQQQQQFQQRQGLPPQGNVYVRGQPPQERRGVGRAKSFDVDQYGRGPPPGKGGSKAQHPYAPPTLGAGQPQQAPQGFGRPGTHQGAPNPHERNQAQHLIDGSRSVGPGPPPPNRSNSWSQRPGTPTLGSLLDNQNRPANLLSGTRSLGEAPPALRRSDAVSQQPSAQSSLGTFMDKEVGRQNTDSLSGSKSVGDAPSTPTRDLSAQDSSRPRRGRRPVSRSTDTI